ncbi:MAG: class I SAM-dependent methyltransferase [Scytonema sp. PMC 1069.18]|nr:class I SAM-dependent methyltransferase [Scytonema sp. PMC 1069.18]MEC4887060.1 class I SAM-dependent methyltransferase [Scytonema sp. PMC 1070.18]
MHNFTEREILKRRNALKIPIHHGDFFVLRQIQQFTNTQIPRIIKPGMIVGDIGCGEQPLRQLIESCGGKYVGVDVVQNLQGTVEIVADISAIPLPDETFDVIICTEVLEHSFEPHKALQELSRLLKPSGAILITTPFCYPLHEIPYDFSRITPFYIQYWLPKLGFKQPEIISMGGNELEVIATAWGHIWKPGEKTDFFRRIIFAFLRVVMNIVVLLISGIFKSLMPVNYFLNLACVAYKSPDKQV